MIPSLTLKRKSKPAPKPSQREGPKQAKAKQKAKCLLLLLLQKMFKMMRRRRSDLARKNRRVSVKESPEETQVWNRQRR
jgi:hypothetical protein